MTWRQLIGYITTHVVEFSRLSFGSAASVSSDETQVFFAPPLPTPTNEKLICENFIRPRVNRRKGSKVSIIRTFLEYII